MKILFDQGTPAPLKPFLTSHKVQTVFELGWSNLTNGELLTRAEQSFDVLITTDQQLRYQQNLVQKTRNCGFDDNELAENQGRCGAGR